LLLPYPNILGYDWRMKQQAWETELQNDIKFWSHTYAVMQKSITLLLHMYIQVNLTLCLIKYHVKRAHGGSGGIVPWIINLSNGEEWLASCPGHSTQKPKRKEFLDQLIPTG
jgi:hypothetical protein